MRQAKESAMRILACPLLLIAAAAAPAAHEPSPKITVFSHNAGLSTPKCQAAEPVPVEQNATEPLIHPLGEEPGARQEIAVLQVGADGCPTPIVVRENVGGTSPPLTASNGSSAAQTSSTSRP